MTRLLEVSTYQITTFKTLFEILCNINIYVDIIFDLENDDDKIMKINQLDSRKSLFVNLELHNNCFVKFNGSVKKFVTRIEASAFKKVLKFIDTNTVLLNMYIEDDDEKVLKIDVEKMSGFASKITYAINLFDVEENICLEVESESHLLLPLQEFNEICSKMKLIDYELIKLEYQDCKFIMKCNNKKISKTVEFSDNWIVKKELRNRHATFDVNTFILFENMSNLSDTIKISMNETILMTEYDVGDCGKLVTYSSSFLL